MYFYELFSHADRFTHRTQILSNATFVLILCTTLTFLPPFLLTYYTGDFWLQELIYSEQPVVDQTNYILQTLNNANNQFFASSYSTLNENFQNSLVSTAENKMPFDTDGDGLIDQFQTTFDLTFADSTTQISSLNIWLLFQFQLSRKQYINMETMALISFVSPATLTPGSNQNITIYGDLTFEQRKPIQNSGSDATYNTPIIDTTSSSLSPDLNLILDNYFVRNYYTSYQTQYISMAPRTTTVDTTKLTVNIIVNVGRQAIRYRPGFWQAFKWGWIQYICVLIPFMMIFNRLKVFVFSNQIVRTSVPLPKHRHQA
ncbi:unnamed protein product [Adineta steineri]|uniref:Transmembrane protein 231 n=1 Tax=Adineta steineri TaxID=433720 RepID=A0A814C2L1_9BILA|nr:unnamed protein product [Adineta steineri]CAF0971378.1 unnamed protein product [Adineta steineri]